MHFYKNKKTLLLSLIIILLIASLFNLSFKISNLKKESVSIVFIERETIKSLNSFKNPIIENLDSNEFKSALLENTIEVKQFLTLIKLLNNTLDGSIMWDMNELISKYYFSLLELNNKVLVNDYISLEDYNEYKKIYNSLNLLNSKIYDSFSSNNDSKYLAIIYVDIKDDLYQK